VHHCGGKKKKNGWGGENESENIFPSSFARGKNKKGKGVFLADETLQREELEFMRGEGTVPVGPLSAAEEGRREEGDFVLALAPLAEEEKVTGRHSFISQRGEKGEMLGGLFLQARKNQPSPCMAKSKERKGGGEGRPCRSVRAFASSLQKRGKGKRLDADRKALCVSKKGT